MWFESLMGFKEKSPAQVRGNLEVNGTTIASRVNGVSVDSGTLETPTLQALRTAASNCQLAPGNLKVRELVADVTSLHQDIDNAGALFQVASQFNLLEMTGPGNTPELGVDIYALDKTQGPACAIACGAGTIYRNYLAEVNGESGQSAGNQIDCLAGMGHLLGNDTGSLWRMKNGYVLADATGLAEITETLKSISETDRDALCAALQIGVQWNTQVTSGDCKHLVSQAFCSALPVSYQPHPPHLWAEFAQLVLEASYEATLCAAMLNASRTGNRKVYLTLVGGGAFGNQDSWIFAALERAFTLCESMPLDVAIVSYGQSNKQLQSFLSSRGFG